MSGMQALFMSYGPQLLLCDSADFDGTNDFMTRGADLTGSSDGKQGTVSMWFRLDGGDGSDMTMFQAATTLGGAVSRWRVRRVSADIIDIIGANAAGTTILDIETSTTYTAGATWRQLLASWNLATGASHLYITDVDDLTVTTETDDSIDYTVADWAIGGQASGGTKFNGCLAEVYLTLTYIDLSIVYNRRKFISSSGKPVYLGADGSAPTGTAPIVYQRVAVGDAVASFATNLGSGGDFAITGTLTDGSTSPSD